MHIHILGICGTFMGGIAMLARQAGFKVTGSDLNVYPPMSDELKNAGIEIYQGYDAKQLDAKPDLVVVGNVMKRGMPVIERMLSERFKYVSGPAFLEDMYLRERTVLAVSGTHGKTTTSSMLAWILERCGKNPGFLIGGIPENFKISARGTDSGYFVIEADEYDCAFFDKRSKFVHYHPDVLIVNNIEFDHADIFSSVEDIKKQFHHMIRTIPEDGYVIYPATDANAVSAVGMGCWSNEVKVFSDDCPYSMRLAKQDGSSFEILDAASGSVLAVCTLDATGVHNAHNAFMAILAASKIGIGVSDAAAALSDFKMPKRRMELVGTVGKIRIFDDFAHHPTAIALTLQGLRRHVGPERRVVCVFEPRSNSMKMGANKERLGESFADADEVFIYQPESVHWDMSIVERDCPKPVHIIRSTTEDLIGEVVPSALRSEDTVVVIMSNGGFEGMRNRLPEALSAAAAASV